MPGDLGLLIAKAVSLAGGPHPCAALGHRWQFSGGRNCGCEFGGCSVPVYRCAACGDYDYGDNDDAAKIKAECEARDAG